MKTNDNNNIIQLELSKCNMNFLNALSNITFIRETPGMMQTLAEELKSRFDESGVEKCIANVIPYISNELMRPFIGHGVDADIARHCKDSQVLLELLRSCKSNSNVISEIAANEYTDDDTIRILVNEFYYITGIYFGLLKRHNLPLDVMKIIAHHPDEWVKNQLAQYKEAPAEILLLLLEQSESREMRLNIAKHPNATADILRQILKCEQQEDSPNAQVYKEVSNHKDIMTDDILLEILKFWRGNGYEIQCALKDSNASDDVLEYVFNDMREYEALLFYKKTPVKFLKQILQLEEDEKQESYAEWIALHPNSDEQILMEIADKFGTISRVLRNVIQNPNATRDVLDFIIFDVLDRVSNLNHGEMLILVYESRSKLVRFE